MSKNDEIEVKPFSDSFEFGDDWLNDLEEALDFDLPDFDYTLFLTLTLFLEHF